MNQTASSLQLLVEQYLRNVCAEKTWTVITLRKTSSAVKLCTHILELTQAADNLRPHLHALRQNQKYTKNTSQDFHNYVILKTNGKSSITALQKTNLAVKFYTRTHTETDKLKIPPHLTVAESKVHSINTHSPYIHPPPCFTRLSNQQGCFTLIIDTAMRLCPPQVMRVPAGSFTLLPTLICSS